MHPRISRVGLAVAMALASSTLISTTSQAAPLADDSAHGSSSRAARPLSFKPNTGCEGLEGYDAKWASHGDDYGFTLAGTKRPVPKGKRNDPEAGQPILMNGFYQMAEHGGILYATFGGASAPGVTPGALVMLDADTLALFERLAAQTGKSQVQILKEALQEYAAKIS